MIILCLFFGARAHVKLLKRHSSRAHVAVILDLDLNIWATTTTRRPCTPHTNIPNIIENMCVLYLFMESSI